MKHTNISKISTILYSKRKKLTAIVLSVIMILTALPMTVFAASVGSSADDKSVGADVMQDAYTEYNEFGEGSANTKAYLTVDDGSVVVGVPTSIILNGSADAQGEYKGDYSVYAKGDIAGNKTLNIYPETDIVSMTQTGKIAKEATISQLKTSFSSEDIVDGMTITGDISAEGLTAGSWNGEFNFIINMFERAVYYSSLERAVADANNLTTENADVKRENASEAVAAMYVQDSTAYVKMMNDEDNVQSITAEQDTIIDLNNHTLNFSNGAGLLANNDLSIKNGIINTTNAARGLAANTAASTFEINNVTVNADSVSGFNSLLFGVFTKAQKNIINGLTVYVHNVSANNTGGLIISCDKTGTSSVTNSDITLRASSATGVAMQSTGTVNMENCNIDAYGTGKNSCIYGINLSNSSKELNLLNNIIIKVDSDGTVYSNSGIKVNAGIVNINSVNVYSSTNVKQVAGSALNISSGATANIHGGVFETNIDTKTAIDGTDCANAGIINRGTLNIDEANGKVIVKGGNSALSVNDITAVVKINGGTYSAPNHGGLYNLKSKTININSAYFYNSKITGDTPTAPCTAYGGMYSSGAGTITVTNSTVIGGNHGYRQKDANTITTFKNTYIEGQNDVFSISSGTLNIGEGVTVKSKTGVIVEANSTGTINDPNNILGLN